MITPFPPLVEGTNSGLRVKALYALVRMLVKRPSLLISNTRSVRYMINSLDAGAAMLAQSIFDFRICNECISLLFTQQHALQIERDVVDYIEKFPLLERIVECSDLYANDCFDPQARPYCWLSGKPVIECSKVHRCPSLFEVFQALDLSKCKVKALVSKRDFEAFIELFSCHENVGCSLVASNEVVLLNRMFSFDCPPDPMSLKAFLLTHPIICVS
jgi:hypothetical protein